jgi:hypothetical protein
MIFFDRPIDFIEIVFTSEDEQLSYTDHTLYHPVEILEYIRRDNPTDLVYNPKFFKIKTSIKNNKYTTYQFVTTSSYDIVRRLDTIPDIINVKSIEDSRVIEVKEINPSIIWFIMNVDLGDIDIGRGNEPTMRILSQVKYPNNEFLYKVLLRLIKLYPNQWKFILDAYFPDADDVENILDYWILICYKVTDTMGEVYYDFNIRTLLNSSLEYENGNP